MKFTRKEHQLLLDALLAREVQAMEAKQPATQLALSKLRHRIEDEDFARLLAEEEAIDDDKESA